MKHIKLFEQFITEKTNINALIDILTNSMEDMDERSFAKAAKDFKINPKVAKEMFDAYWNLDAKDRFHYDIEEWSEWLTSFGVHESVVTEKQFKGLNGISKDTSLEDITDEQKLNIIKGTGNIIDFIVPKGVSRNFWQVIGTGKIKQNSDKEYYLEGKVIDSPKFKTVEDLIKGVDWASMEDRRQFNS